MRNARVSQGIRNVGWKLSDVGFWSSILARIPVINLLFTKEVRIDVYAVTVSNRIVGKTYKYTRVPTMARELTFLSSLGRDVLCRAAANIVITVHVANGEMVGTVKIPTHQIDMANWRKYSIPLTIIKGNRVCQHLRPMT